MSQNTRGCVPNSAASISASVAATSWLSFSYSASSRTNANTSAASPERAGRMESDISCASYGDRRFDGRIRLVAFEREVFVAEREQVPYGRIEPHDRQRL